MTTRKTKTQIEEEEREKQTVLMGYQYSVGYFQGLLDASWECIDCGNRYEASIDECPNEKLDEASAHVRGAKHRLGYYGIDE